jgi:hypothetical protein
MTPTMINAMQCLTTDLICQACRVFLALAYPGGEAQAPLAKRCTLQLPGGQPIFEYLQNNEAMQCFCQVVQNKSDAAKILLIRLGCAHYPNLKLKAQTPTGDARGEWVFSVDTHDAFSSTSFLPPPDHPDAERWTAMQAANVALKEKIEAAWECAGLLTFNGLLRRGLAETRPFPS